jgi:succinate dehydrogenase/fumarate reductase cytochrome b subunit
VSSCHWEAHRYTTRTFGAAGHKGDGGRLTLLGGSPWLEAPAALRRPFGTPCSPVASDPSGRLAVQRLDLASMFGRHEFLIRRLHSFLGLLPIGGYLVFHLATNGAIIDGLATYQRRADQIHRLGPTTILVLEWSLIFLPILFHGLVGLVIVTRGKRNVVSYPYSDNIRYTLQRATGVIAFAFILWHVFAARPVVGRLRGPAAGGRPLRSGARLHRRRSDPILVDFPGAVRRGHAGCRVPLGQRPLDHRHHLGRLDQPAGPTVGQAALRRDRAGAGRGRHGGALGDAAGGGAAGGERRAGERPDASHATGSIGTRDESSSPCPFPRPRGRLGIRHWHSTSCRRRLYRRPESRPRSIGGTTAS